MLSCVNICRVQRKLFELEVLEDCSLFFSRDQANVKVSDHLFILPKSLTTCSFCQSLRPPVYSAKVSDHLFILPKSLTTCSFCQSLRPPVYSAKVSDHLFILPKSPTTCSFCQPRMSFLNNHQCMCPSLLILRARSGIWARGYKTYFMLN